MEFRSKVDLWLMLVLLIAPAVLLVEWIVMRSPVLLAVLVLVGVTYACLIFPVRYCLTSHELLVRNGLLRRRIALASITQVTPTRNPVSSPALSLDRLEIRYGAANRILISPEDSQTFLSELRIRAPQLRGQ